jgi:hypothetical protein
MLFSFLFCCNEESSHFSLHFFFFFFFHFIYIKRNKKKKLKEICSNFRFRALSRNYKSSHCSDSASQYFRGGRAPRSHSTPSSNMEFLRGVYAFMQVSRSSVSVNIFQLLIKLTFFPFIYFSQHCES